LAAMASSRLSVSEHPSSRASTTKFRDMVIRYYRFAIENALMLLPHRRRSNLKSPAHAPKKAFVDWFLFSEGAGHIRAKQRKGPE
jgi:hypothetical protein